MHLIFHLLFHSSPILLPFFSHSSASLLNHNPRFPVLAILYSSSQPHLRLKVDVKPFEPGLEDWDILSPLDVTKTQQQSQWEFGEKRRANSNCKFKEIGYTTVNRGGSEQNGVPWDYTGSSRE